MSAQTKTLRWWAAIVLLLVLAFGMRVWNLSSVPPGLTHDEASNGHDSAAILRGEHHIYFPVGYGHEPLYNYSVALTTLFLGQSIFTLRITTVAWGMAQCLLTAALARRWWGRKAAIFVLATYGAAFWALMLSRVGLRAPTLPALLAGSVLAYDHATSACHADRRRWAWYSLSGVLLGAGFYTYMASRGTPLVYIVVLGGLAVADRTALRRIWAGTLMLLAVAALVGAPLFLYLHANPELEQRIDQLGAAITALGQGQWRPIWANISDSLPMLFTSADPQWLYNVAGRPGLDPLLAVLFVIGLVRSVWDVGRGSHGRLRPQRGTKMACACKQAGHDDPAYIQTSCRSGCRPDPLLNNIRGGLCSRSHVLRRTTPDKDVPSVPLRPASTRGHLRNRSHVHGWISPMMKTVPGERARRPRSAGKPSVSIRFPRPFRWERVRVRALLGHSRIRLHGSHHTVRRNLLLLAWIAGGMAPALLTPVDYNLLHAIAAMPAVMLTVALGATTLCGWATARLRDPRLQTVTVVVAATAFVATVAGSAHAYFVTWAGNRNTHVAYHQHVVALGHALDEQNDTRPVVMTSLYPGRYHDPYTMEVTLRREDLTLRWVDGRDALFVPRVATRLAVEEQTQPPDELWTWLQPDLAPWVTLRYREDDIPSIVRGYSWNAPASWDRLAGGLASKAWIQGGDPPPAVAHLATETPVSFAGTVTLAGYEWNASAISPDTPVAGSTVTLLTAWEIDAATDQDLVIFAHLLAEDGTLIAQDDRMAAPSWQWKPGDRFVHVNRLALPVDLAPDSYVVALGLYDRATLARLPVESQPCCTNPQATRLLLSLEVLDR